MQVPVPRLEPGELAGPGGEPSSLVRARVEAARARAAGRPAANRSLARGDLDALPWDTGAAALLRSAAERLALTGRGWDRVRRVARTVADLEGEEAVGEGHVAEALSLRAVG